MKQLFFLIELNLEPLQMLLREKGHSTFLQTEPEIGLPENAEDAIIIARIAEQKKNLGIDRIIVTKDKKMLQQIGNSQIKLIILNDKTYFYKFYDMKLKQLSNTIITKANKMIKRTPGQAVEYVECAGFY